MSLVFPMVLSLASFVFPVLAEQDHPDGAGDPEQLGSVEFANSCSAEVQPQFARAVAMLHSFWYDEAGRRFREVAEGDPRCAIAWWGVAMSHWQPLWEPRGPNPEAFHKGLAAIQKARELGGSRLERNFIAALEKFYANADTIDHRDRVLAYEKAMEALHATHPEDTEARVFYALSLLASATSLPPDKTYQRQRKAGELLMPVFRSQPNHPGAAHYIIHAYDYPALASGALEAARRYAKIAPDSPHAQHMPSHIFTRLGLWDESIASNRNVIRAARRHRIAGEELHATDYLIFTLLQKGEDEQALHVIRDMPKPPQPGALQYFAGIYAYAAIPARYAVERRQWKEAAELPKAENFPGGRYAWADAAIHFARALGAARTGNVEQARHEVEKLTSFRNTLHQFKEDYWATQVEIQRRAAEAWLAFAEGRRDQALELMRSAADLEDTTDKHPVTPGQIVPARDLLGQMLLELTRPDEALAEFNNVLQAEPGRFGALYGAARAAELSGRADLARQWYGQLVGAASGSKRDEVHHAQAYLPRSSDMDRLDK
jgi:tetratricopeptide (TPR) repeat protein